MMIFAPKALDDALKEREISPNKMSKLFLGDDFKDQKSNLMVDHHHSTSGVCFLFSKDVSRNKR